MHECKLCGAEVSLSIYASVCLICARKIRALLNRCEDMQSAGKYLAAGNDRGYELQPLYLDLPDLRPEKKEEEKKE
jgi:hypothetical protein